MPYRFKSRLLANTTQFGTFVFSPDPAVVEILGRSGYDFAIVDREHCALSWREIENHARAAAATDLSLLVRVSRPDPGEVMHALDLGAEGVVIPHYGLDRAASLATMRALRYAPQGERGTCTGVRAAGFGLSPFAQVAEEANSGAAAIVQIEDASVLDGLDELLAEAPVDAVMPGLADLSTSLGFPGDFRHPEVAAAAERLRASVEKAALPLGLYLPSVEMAPHWAGMRAAFKVLSIDYKMLGETYGKALAALREQG